jgi:predicted transcriptional regulator
LRSKRSKSFLAAEAIVAYVQQEEWQLGEIETAGRELDAGHSVSHEKAAAWLILSTQPQMGRPGRLPGTRELVLSGTPFIVPYRVKRERLELLAVFDGRRQWPGRL